jgi:hypothetical protein
MQNAQRIGSSAMPLNRQADLFTPDAEPEFFRDQVPHGERPDPEKIRLQLVSLIEKVRGAQTMPWPKREARMWQIAFPQMTNWLPPDEGDQLRFEFAQEMQRLAKAA